MTEIKVLGIPEKSGKECLNSFTPPKAMVSQNKSADSSSSQSTTSGSTQEQPVASSGSQETTK